MMAMMKMTRTKQGMEQMSLWFQQGYHILSLFNHTSVVVNYFNCCGSPPYNSDCIGERGFISF